MTPPTYDPVVNSALTLLYLAGILMAAVFMHPGWLILTAIALIMVWAL
jgi:hypothetical protein